MELSEFYKSKAAKELREDDTRRTQALDQFREWISKQSYIQHCRTDDSFLLRFLRVKKYLNAEAFKMLEKFLIVHQAYPQWFSDFGLHDARMKELFDAGYAFPLKERDQNGCRVVVIQGRKVDPKKFNANDVYKIISWVFANLKEEPETQVAGAVFIFDCKDVTMEQISLFGFSDVKNFLGCIQNAIPVRFKQALFVNFPSYGVALADFIKSFLTTKLKDRTHFSAGSEKLFDHVDKKILPQEYGGEVPIQEMVEHFKKFAESQKDKIKQYDEFRIDMEIVKKYKADSIDSFKKLEVD